MDLGPPQYKFQNLHPTAFREETHASIGVGTCKITPKAFQYVNDVLRSGRLSYGPYIQKFETVFASAHDCKFAIMTNSGTSSLVIALHALKLRYGWKDGDELIVPSVTFVATLNVVIQLGLKPVIVDVDPVYYELDPSKIEQAITPNSRCIIPVHLFGHPCAMIEISEIARTHHLRILEDSCETMFTRLEEKSVGSIGEIGCFSTYVAHLLCTGVGGLCTTNNPELAISMRSLANHGRDSIYLNIDDDNNRTAEEMRLIIKNRFSFATMGYSFRSTELEGALGLAEFENRESMLKSRRENAQFFLSQLHGLKEYLQLPSIRPGAGHAFMTFPIVLKQETKTNIVEHLESRGIETRDMLPIINQPVYRDLLGIKETDFPVAQWINQNGFYIGCHQGLSELEREHIVDSFHGYFAKETIHDQSSCLLVMAKIRGSVDPLVLQNIINSFQMSLFHEKILLDSGSGLAVTQAFLDSGFKVISEKLGKGALLKKALEQTHCKYILVVGVDGSDDPADLTDILLKLKQGYELVVGSRFMPGGDRQSVRLLSYRSFGNRFFGFLLSVLFRRNVSDCNNLLRGFVRSSVRDLRLNSDGDAVMFEMTASVLENDLRYTECPALERRPLLNLPKRNRVILAVVMLIILGKQRLQQMFKGNRILQRAGSPSIGTGIALLNLFFKELIGQ